MLLLLFLFLLLFSSFFLSFFLCFFLLVRYKQKKIVHFRSKKKTKKVLNLYNYLACVRRLSFYVSMNGLFIFFLFSFSVYQKVKNFPKKKEYEK